MEMVHYAIYDDRPQAETMARQLRAAGIRPGALQQMLLARHEAANGEHAGSFDEGERHMHGASTEHTGSFAEGERHMHGASGGHVGSFAEGERHMHGAASSHVGSFAEGFTSHRHAEDIERALVTQGIAAEEARRAVAAMRDGSVLLLVRAEGAQAERVAAMMRSMA